MNSCKLANCLHKSVLLFWILLCMRYLLQAPQNNWRPARPLRGEGGLDRSATWHHWRVNEQHKNRMNWMQSNLGQPVRVGTGFDPPRWDEPKAALCAAPPQSRSGRRLTAQKRNRPDTGSVSHFWLTVLQLTHIINQLQVVTSTLKVVNNWNFRRHMWRNRRTCSLSHT